MGERLISDEFMRFYESLDDNITDLDEMIVCIARALDSVSEIMHIGKMDMEIEAPITGIDAKGFSRTITMYASRHGFHDAPVEDFFVGSDLGTMSITSFPQDGYEWDDDAQKDMHFLAKAIYILCGKARLSGVVKNASSTDRLTGIANTDGILQFGGMLMTNKRMAEYAGLYINIKNFKSINDLMGSRKGDQVLKKYARKLNDFLLTDEMVARLGSDNFFALVKHERIDSFLTFLSVLAIDVTDEVENAYMIDVFSRAGIYVADLNDSISDVLNCSSIALNIAKASQKDNHIWFKPHMLERLMSDKSISSLFPQALKNMEFMVYYQPQINLDDFSICGCEALVRWYRDGKLVSPSEFVPRLEVEGNIRDLDFYVFQKVCQDIRDWEDRGIAPVRVAANFAKNHLRNPNFGRDILTVMNQYDVDPEYIEIELTEMSGYEDFSALSNFVRYMSKNGVRTSLDDFGTSYSSLHLLKDLKVNAIKIDKSFIDSIEGNETTEEIMVRNIVNMIRELDMEAIAEGVETEEQIAFLKSIQCNAAQGYYFDRPLEHDLFEERLENKETIYQE